MMQTSDTDPRLFERPALTEEQTRILCEEITKSGKYFLSADTIALETYARIFGLLDLKGKNIVSVGAWWFPVVFDEDRMLLSLENKGINFFPVDIDALKTKSWLLPDPSEESVTVPVQADGLNLPFWNETMDGYVTQNLVNDPKFATMENVENLLKEAHRVLKSGGFLLVSTFGYLKYVTTDGEIIYRHWTPETQVGKEDMIGMMRRIGFESIEELPDGWASEEVIVAQLQASLNTTEITSATAENSVRLFARKI